MKQVQTFEIKETSKPRRFTLEYDRLKGKYYLNIHEHRMRQTITFFGKWPLKEYLRDTENLSEKEINKLITQVKKIGL